MIAVRENVLKMMLHAIGYHPGDVRHGRYLYYRNYYGTSAGPDRREWENLADKGYACRDGNTGIFMLTNKGLNFLEGVLETKIQNKHITEYEVFNVFIDCSLDCSESGMNVVYVANTLRISRHHAKKLVDSLRSKGLIELYCVSTSADGNTVSPPRWLYTLTEKAMHTDKYKKLATEREEAK
ncbi:MAG: hypothetical protein GX957_02810 [Clostridiaceae bacterium]|nr:hypothetical protein [Clostridiaceae bacterium]